MASKSKMDYIRKYNERHYERITLLVPKGSKDTIKTRARALGKSMNEYISGLVVMDLCGGVENESAD